MTCPSSLLPAELCALFAADWATTPAVIVMVAGLLVASFARGYSGFGFSAILVASWSLVAPPSLPVAVAVMFEVSASIMQAASVWRDVDWRRIGLLLAGALVCSPFGVAGAHPCGALDRASLDRGARSSVLMRLACRFAPREAGRHGGASRGRRRLRFRQRRHGDGGPAGRALSCRKLHRAHDHAGFLHRLFLRPRHHRGLFAGARRHPRIAGARHGAVMLARASSSGSCSEAGISSPRLPSNSAATRYGFWLGLP